MKRLQQQVFKIDKTSSKAILSKSLTGKKDSSDTDDEVKPSSAKKGNAPKFSPFLSLEPSMNDKTLQVYKDEEFVCIRDKYPKSRCHLLLIPYPIKGTKLLKVEDLIRLPNSIDFLKEMKSLAHKIVETLPQSLNKLEFKYGFHSIQSMQPLHMHIITSDFQSDCLKNKKHWNSFNTSYFIKLDDLIEHLAKDLNNLSIDYFKTDKFNLKNKQMLEDYLKLDLKCNVCSSKQSNMPNLKKHLLTHNK